MRGFKKASKVTSIIAVTVLAVSTVSLVYARNGSQISELHRQENSGKPSDNNLLIEPRGNKVKVSEVDSEGNENNKNEPKELDELEVETNDSEDVSTDSGQVTLKSQDNAALIIRNKLAAQTKFPLMVNLDTNELIVTTPKGQKIVTVLPDAAVANMLAANVLDQPGGKGGINWLATQATPTATESATPTSSVSATPTTTGEPSPTSTSSSETVQEGSSIQLVLTDDGKLAYEINGVKTEKFLGIFNVKLHRLVFVSAEDGGLLAIKQNLLYQILDTLSL